MGTRIRIDPSSRLPLDSPSNNQEMAHAISELRRTLDARPKRFVELCATTNFSFLSGATPPEAMVARAAALGLDTLGITDRDGLYGIVRAFEAGKESGVRIICGCELTLERDESSFDAEMPPSSLADDSSSSQDSALERVLRGRGNATTLTVLVENHAGYTNLCRILTESHRRHPKSIASAKPQEGDDDEPLARNVHAGIPLAYVCQHAEGLWALADATILTPKQAPMLMRAFGQRLSVAVYLHKDGEDRARIDRTLRAIRTFGIRGCATQRPRYAVPEDKPIFDVLHCIREGITLDEAGRDLMPNAEAHLKEEDEMFRLFSLHPEWVERSRWIADQCRFGMNELSYRFPYELSDLGAADPTPAPETAQEALRRLTYEGAMRRWPGGIDSSVRAQIEKELTVIETLNVAPYFLSVRAIVEMARRKDILCQGRGSAANSAVCFCLGVTAVDPSRSNMLFERFMSVERSEPPDIDVDFEHERREEVIQEIYSTYGRDRAAMVCEVICYRAKSALREVGKVMGLSLEQVDRLANVASWWDGVGAVSESRLRAAGFSPDDLRMRHTLVMARRITGFPRHLSIHVGGFVLSASPLCEIAPVEPATMEGRTIIAWDKDDIDTLGFFKVDVLGLGMLTAIRKCLDLVRDSCAIHPSLNVPRALVEGSAIERLAAIPAEEPKVYEALGKADTVGVFQIESRAQMAMLPRLLPKCFYDLVIEVALVRPGPIQGGMVHPYLRRRRGEEHAEPPHPRLLPILERTLGVPIFQEQVMQIAIEGAGYSGGEADRLRRDMAAWRKTGSLEAHRHRLLRGFAERGIPASFAETLYQQIHGFAEYGFPESHAASFALLVYASAWLKVFFPAEFAAALINSQPMGFYSPSTIVQDAQRHGVEILPIDIAESDWYCTCGRTPSGRSTLRLGFRMIAGLGLPALERLLQARAQCAFRSIDDVVTRGALDKRQAMLLAESGALDGLAKDTSSPRRSALWEIKAPRQTELFATARRTGRAPRLPSMTRAEQLVLDYERTGVSVSDHPLKLLRQELSARRIITSREVLSQRPGSRIQVAGLVTCRQRPATASGVVFLTLEDELGMVNIVVWPKLFDAQRTKVISSTMLVVQGRIQRSDDPKGERAPNANAPASVVHVVAERLEDLSETLPAIPTQSRDFC